MVPRPLPYSQVAQGRVVPPLWPGPRPASRCVVVVAGEAGGATDSAGNVKSKRCSGSPFLKTSLAATLSGVSLLTAGGLGIVASSVRPSREAVSGTEASSRLFSSCVTSRPENSFPEMGLVKLS